MHVQYVRDFGKYGDAVPIPDLIRLQTVAYKRFLQVEAAPSKRKPFGLEALLREVFPIESYDGNTKLSYLDYSLEPPRYSSDECRELGLTYGMPFRIRVRLQRKDIEEVQEESIYLGEMVQLTLQSGAVKLRANVRQRAADEPIARGTEMMCTIDPRDVVLLSS